MRSCVKIQAFQIQCISISTKYLFKLPNNNHIIELLGPKNSSIEVPFKNLISVFFKLNLNYLQLIKHTISGVPREVDAQGQFNKKCLTSKILLTSKKTKKVTQSISGPPSGWHPGPQPPLCTLLLTIEPPSTLC